MRFLVGLLGIEPSLYRLRRQDSPPDYPPHAFCRAAGNRTQSLRTRIVRTTGILQPDRKHVAPNRTDYRTTSERVRVEIVYYFYRTSAGSKMRSILQPELKPHTAHGGWAAQESVTTLACWLARDPTSFAFAQSGFRFLGGQHRNRTCDLTRVKRAL